jgi:hypothetical protein
MGEERRNGQIAAGSLYLQSRESTRDRRDAEYSATLAGTIETIGYELRKVCSGKRETVRRDGVVQGAFAAILQISRASGSRQSTCGFFVHWGTCPHFPSQ